MIDLSEVGAGPWAGPAPRDPLLGAQVGSYRLVRELGRGASGSVYLGEHPGIGSRVAVKVLHAGLVHHAEAVRRFELEARAANRVASDHVVQVLDLGLLAPGQPYLVMEYLEGQTLAELLSRGALELPRALHLLRQLGACLGAAHQAGVAHRDLKPENVLLVERGGDRRYVKLTDFGIAKLWQESSLGRTAAGALMGTPLYMAPEQCSGGPVDGRSDQYALGVIAYQMTAGRLPFDGPGVGAVLLAHQSATPGPLSAHRAGLPRGWEQAILRALAKAPEERFARIEELVDALEQALAPAPGPGLDELAGLLRSEPDPYRALGLPRDAATEAVLARARALRAELSARLALRQLPAEAAALRRAHARLTTAEETLADPLQRLVFDAACGNHRGVARALVEGMPEALVKRCRESFLAQRPGLVGVARGIALQAREAHVRGDAAGAASACAAALALDPLNLGLHQTYDWLRGLGRAAPG